jgi:hypothetical protein
MLLRKALAAGVSRWHPRALEEATAANPAA